MIGNDAEEFFDELFSSLLYRYQAVLSLIKSKFRSWWILHRFSSLNKSKKATINPKTNDYIGLQKCNDNRTKA